MKKQDLFPVSKVETNDALRDVSRERGELFFRIAIAPNGGADGMTEEQRKLFDKMDDKAKEMVLNGALKHEISNVFKTGSFIPDLANLTEDQLTDDYQNAVVARLETLFKEKGADGNPRKFLFTYYTYSVEELLAGTEYTAVTKLYDDNNKVLRQRNSLYFGFMDDEENVLSFMRDRLLDAIEDGTLSVTPSNAPATTSVVQPTTQAQPAAQAAPDPTNIKLPF